MSTPTFNLEEIEKRTLAFYSTFNIPRECPSCGSPVRLSSDFAHLTCSNPSCEGKLSRRIERFAKALGLDNFGPSVCDILANEINEPSQILYMNPAQWSGLFSVGISARLQAELSKLGNIRLSDALSAVSIPRCSAPTAKKLASAFKTLEAVLNASELDLCFSIDSFGDGLSKIIWNGIQAAKSELLALDAHVHILPQDEVAEGAQPFKGMNIVITGPLSTDRNVWKEKIEKGGGRLASAVSRNTTVLITNVVSSTTKSKAAKALGVPVEKEQWLLDKMS